MDNSLNYSFHVDTFVVTDVGSYKDVIQSVRFNVRATNKNGLKFDRIHVINYDLTQLDNNNFIQFDNITKEKIDQWIIQRIQGENFENIKKQLYDKFFPTTRTVTPVWVEEERQAARIKEQHTEEQFNLDLVEPSSLSPDEYEKLQLIKKLRF